MVESSLQTSKKRKKNQVMKLQTRLINTFHNSNNMEGFLKKRISKVLMLILPILLELMEKLLAYKPAGEKPECWSNWRAEVHVMRKSVKQGKFDCAIVVAEVLEDWVTGNAEEVELAACQKRVCSWEAFCK